MCLNFINYLINNYLYVIANRLDLEEHNSSIFFSFLPFLRLSLCLSLSVFLFLSLLLSLCAFFSYPIWRQKSSKVTIGHTRISSTTSLLWTTVRHYFEEVDCNYCVPSGAMLVEDPISSHFLFSPPNLSLSDSSAFSAMFSTVQWGVRYEF